jgi:tellurite resistance protein TerC
MVNIGESWMWAGFFAFVIAMLAIDLLILGGRKAHKVGVKEAAAWSLAWLVLALIFNGLLWWYLNRNFGEDVANQKSIEFLTGYVIEKSLSVDNVFVFLTIFSAFNVAPEHQRRVLLYGVLGAIVLRALMILAGAWVVREFDWVLYLFGLFLVITGIKMFIMADSEPDIKNNIILKFAKRHLRITDEFRGEKFTVIENGVRFFTPLFLVLLMVELSDVIFAVDSIPAIFAITTDPFIVFTSNIFAIMGLRALYFLLADMADRFHLLKYGLAILLLFIGVKMLITYWVHVPTYISLSVIGIILTISIVASLFSTRITYDKETK